MSGYRLVGALGPGSSCDLEDSSCELPRVESGELQDTSCADRPILRPACASNISS